jgi:hypothetical protein
MKFCCFSRDGRDGVSIRRISMLLVDLSSLALMNGYFGSRNIV